MKNTKYWKSLESWISDNDIGIGRRNEKEQFRKFPCQESLFKSFDREIFEAGVVGLNFKVKWRRDQRVWWESVTDKYKRGRGIAFDGLNLGRVNGYN